jgi:hypothetical protein
MKQRLICKTKEREEGEGAQDDQPTAELMLDKNEGVGAPHDPRELGNVGIVVAEGGPVIPPMTFPDPLLGVRNKEINA